MSEKENPAADHPAGVVVDEARYDALAASMERGEYTKVPGSLRRGRPAAVDAHRGSSPVRTIRFPHELDAQLADYANNVDSTPSEVVRRAVAEYMQRHPLGA